MALIVEYHVTAAQYDVIGTLTAGTSDIEAGMLVVFDSTYGVNASPATDDVAQNAAATTVIGIAGDSRRATEGQTTAYSAPLLTGSKGAQSRWTENRVSDFYNETLASGKITVYQGGGKFWTDQIGTVTTAAAPGVPICTSATGRGLVNSKTTATNRIGICAGAVSAYPSGVPGTDTTDGSTTLGTYLPIILRV
jgi:hypothetical protein